MAKKRNRRKGKGSKTPNKQQQPQNKAKLTGSIQYTNPQKIMPRPRQFKGSKGTGLSKCAELYAKALIAPFSKFDELPCVPCTPADLTYRFKALYRTSFSTGTAGCGFVSWAPLCAANDVVSIRTSLATFAGNTYVGSGATVADTTKGTLPYTNGQYNVNPCFQARLVASGCRIINTTAPLYRQGNILANRANTGFRLSSTTLNALQQSPESVRIQADREEWVYWSFIPQDEEDYDFPDGQYNYIADTAGNKAAQNYGLLVSGASTSNPSTFDVEIMEFWEFAGGTATAIPPQLIRSEADPVGFSRALEAVAAPRTSLDVEDVAENSARSMIEAMANSDSAAKTVEDLLGLSGMSMGNMSGLILSLTKMLLE